MFRLLFYIATYNTFYNKGEPFGKIFYIPYIYFVGGRKFKLGGLGDEILKKEEEMNSTLLQFAFYIF